MKSIVLVKNQVAKLLKVEAQAAAVAFLQKKLVHIAIPIMACTI